MLRQITTPFGVNNPARPGLFPFFSLLALFLLVLIADRNVSASGGYLFLSNALPQQPQQNAGAQKAQDVVVLEPGKPIEREMAGGQSHTYRITLAKGQYLNVVLDQRGIDVVVQLLAPDGKQVAEFDSEIRRQGQETVSHVAEVAGSYRLNVQVKQKEVPAGGYEIRVVELRAATEKDQMLQEARMQRTEFLRLYRSGKYDEALQPAERALELREKVLGPQHPDVAASLNNLGSIYSVKGAHNKAEPLYQRALAIVEQSLGPEHPDLAPILNNLANTYGAIGIFDKAEQLYKRTLSIVEKALGPEHPDLAASLNGLANLYSVKGDFRSAEPLHKRTVAIFEKALGPEHPNLAVSLYSLANLYSEKSYYEEAEPLYKRALAIWEKALGPEHNYVAASLNGLANLYSAKGDYDKAELQYQRALTILEKVLGPGHPDLAVSLNGLANLDRAKNDYDKAASKLQRALAIFEKALGTKHPYVAGPLNNLANLYNDIGDYDKAEPLYQRALAIWEKALGPEHYYVAAPLDSLGNLYDAQGVYAKAEPMHQRALAIREKTLGPEHPLVADSLNNLARHYEAKGDITQAITFLSRANAIGEHNIALNFATGSERQKLAYLTTLSARTDQTISFHVYAAPNDPIARKLAATTIFQRKGRVLDIMSDSLAALRRRFNAQDRDLLDQLRETNTRLARLVFGELQKITPAEYQQRIKALEEQKEKLEAGISRHSTEFRAQIQPITLAAVQSAIPANAALIEFASYRSFNPKIAKNDQAYRAPHYVVYVVRHQGEIQWKELGEAKEIDSAIDALRRALRDPGRQDVKTLARVVDIKIMQPVRAMIGGAIHLLISPDGALNLIPFEALVDEQSRYLVERFTITYLTTGRDLLRLQVARESKSNALVVANPDYGNLPEQQTGSGEATASKQARRAKPRERSIVTAESLSELKFLPLQETAKEAKAIERQFPDATMLIGKQATETLIKQAVAPKILHIATHGFFLEDQSVKFEGSKLRRGDDGLRSGVSVKIKDPLLRSGLAMEGANLRRESNDDGILTASEAAGLNLWGTKVVVLSACDTGLGEVKTGEGVYGLRRALVLAGAETQMMSLWKVDNYATRKLMTEYYTRLRRGQGRGEALRQVQLRMLQYHPYYWASFIRSGEWASLDGSGKAIRRNSTTNQH